MIIASAYEVVSRPLSFVGVPIKWQVQMMGATNRSILQIKPEILGK